MYKRQERIWRERIAEGPFRAALVAGDGKVYFLNRGGLCTVLDAAADEKKVLAQNQLDGDFFATPAIGDKTIYLRAHRKLYAVSGK